MRLHLFCIVFFLAAAANSQTYNYYYGNIHSHTGFSDGSQDSLSSGVSTPAGAYSFAKLSQHFNFLGISEHNHYSSNNNPGFQIQSWPIGMNQASAANQENTFLCLFGMEWGVSSSTNGHVLVYGFPQLIGWETNNYQVFNAKTDYDGLFRKVKNQPGAFCALAHPSSSDFNVGTGSLLGSPYSSAYDSAIVATPLRNGLYNTTTTNYDAYPAGNYFSYYRGLLAKGYHLGISYDHDNHMTTFGRNNAGRLVVMMESLTTANFFDAMHKMHFYASDDWNAKIDFKMNGNMMGAIVSGTVNPSFSVTHNDEDGELADSIKIWRGISNSATPSQVVSITKSSNTASYTDNTMVDGIEYYYFAEIKQADRQWIVTSPIWYTNTLPQSLKEEQMAVINFNYFPNPVSQHLSISTSECAIYKIFISDISGRNVYSDTFNDKDFSVDLSSFAKGVYSLRVENEKGSATKKLIVE